MADKKPGKRQVFRHMFEAAQEGSPFKIPKTDDVEVTVIGDPKTWKRVSTPCSQGQHDPVPDPTENSIEGYVGYKCRRCKIGWIVKAPEVVNN